MNEYTLAHSFLLAFVKWNFLIWNYWAHMENILLKYFLKSFDQFIVLLTLEESVHFHTPLSFLVCLIPYILPFSYVKSSTAYDLHFLLLVYFLKLFLISELF